MTDNEDAQAPRRQASAQMSRDFFRGLIQVRAVEALRHREFRLLCFGHSFTSMASWMNQVTRGRLIYELTDSALQRSYCMAPSIRPIGNLALSVRSRLTSYWSGFLAPVQGIFAELDNLVSLDSVLRVHTILQKPRRVLTSASIPMRPMGSSIPFTQLTQSAGISCGQVLRVIIDHH